MKKRYIPALVVLIVGILMIVIGTILSNYEIYQVAQNYLPAHG